MKIFNVKVDGLQSPFNSVSRYRSSMNLLDEIFKNPTRIVADIFSYLNLMALSELFINGDFLMKTFLNIFHIHSCFSNDCRDMLVNCFNGQTKIGICCMK